MADIFSFLPFSLSTLGLPLGWLKPLTSQTSSAALTVRFSPFTTEDLCDLEAAVIVHEVCVVFSPLCSVGDWWFKDSLSDFSSEGTAFDMSTVF